MYIFSALWTLKLMTYFHCFALFTVGGSQRTYLIIPAAGFKAAKETIFCSFRFRWEYYKKLWCRNWHYTVPTFKWYICELQGTKMCFLFVTLVILFTILMSVLLGQMCYSCSWVIVIFLTTKLFFMKLKLLKEKRKSEGEVQAALNLRRLKTKNIKKNYIHKS